MKPHNLGVLLRFGPENGDNQERSTFTCGHCQQVGYVGDHDGGMCLKCANLLCRKAACHDECVPVRKKLEADIAAAYRKSQNAMVMGL